MPKRVPKKAKRVPFNCLVAPETKALLAKLKERARSQGEIVDQAVAAWAEFAEAGRLLAAPLGLHSKTSNPKGDDLKVRLAKGSNWKHGKREKGDRGR